jgi:hypothetical protein
VDASLAEVRAKSLPLIIITWSLNGGAGLLGKSGRKTANACDEIAKDASRNTAARFMLVATNTSQKV